MEYFLDELLKRLQTDCIDYYLVHSVDLKTMNRLLKRDLLKFISRAKDEGKIKHIGFSYHGPKEEFEEVIDWLKKTHNIEIKIKFIPHTWMYTINDISEEKRFNEYTMYIFKTFYDAAFNAFDYMFNNILIK